MVPGFDTEGFDRVRRERTNPCLDALIDKVKDLNRAIAEDKSLGRGFRIGHSYFCSEGAATAEGLAAIVYYDIVPMLEEYWFDDEARVDSWRRALAEALAQ